MFTENQETKVRTFNFNKRFGVVLGISYTIFCLAILVPFLLGYIDTTIATYGAVGFAQSVVLMGIVWYLNRVDHRLRQRIGYIVAGGWAGLFIGVVFGIALFGHQIIATIGSLTTLVIVIMVLPSAGLIIGYLAGKRKDSNTLETKKAYQMS